jgi:DNA-directed RNA polymerase I, II, and III subunit RPABC1
VKNGIPFSHSIDNRNMEERALQTLKSMLTERGIKSETFEPVGNPLDETRMYTFGGILIVFSEKTRLTPAEFKNILAYASENNHSAGTIIITLSKAPESVIELLRQHISNKENPLVQLFYISHLNIDISKHRKVPKHRLLTDDEKTKLTKTYNILHFKQLPKLDSQDAMARWIGARPGDVVEITGLCVSSADNTRYRYCIPNVYEV